MQCEQWTTRDFQVRLRLTSVLKLHPSMLVLSLGKARGGYRDNPQL